MVPNASKNNRLTNVTDSTIKNNDVVTKSSGKQKSRRGGSQKADQQKLKHSSTSSCHGESTLHTACRYYPSVSVVESLLDLPTISVRKKDTKGRLPLHVACKKGAPAESIKIIMDEYQSACMIPDNDGKLPLHHMCDNYTRNASPMITEDEVIDDFMSILESMLEHSTNSLLKLDNNGLNPIECAIEAGIDYDVIYCLQKATEELLKTRQSRGVRD